MFVDSALGRRRQHRQQWCFVAGLLLFLLRMAAGATHFEADDAHYYGSASFFRFRDFVPRPTVEGEQLAHNRNGAARKPRGIQFHADGRDVTVDMEFVLPFVRIPVERSMQLTSFALRNLVNLNTSTLLWTGLMVAVAAVVALIVKVLNAPLVYGFDYGKQTRNGDTSASVPDPFNLVTYGHAQNGSIPAGNVMKVNDFMSAVEAKLQQRNIDMTACVQKSICAYVKKAHADVRLGVGSSWAKIVDGFTSLEPMQHYLSGTAVHSAIEAARNADTCDSTYRSCKWLQPENKFIKFMLNYLVSFSDG